MSENYGSHKFLFASCVPINHCDNHLHSTKMMKVYVSGETYLRIFVRLLEGIGKDDVRE